MIMRPPVAFLAAQLLFASPAFARNESPTAVVIPLFDTNRQPLFCVRERRALADVNVAVIQLARAVEDELSKAELDLRGLSLARAIVYWSNVLSPEPGDEWPRRRQIQEAVRTVRFMITARIHHVDLPIVREVLSRSVVRAQHENRILNQMAGQTFNMRRTDRVLRELARRMPLTCETLLLRPDPFATRENGRS
jgi:hypothetical protein